MLGAEGEVIGCAKLAVRTYGEQGEPCRGAFVDVRCTPRIDEFVTSGVDHLCFYQNR